MLSTHDDRGRARTLDVDVGIKVIPTLPRICQTTEVATRLRVGKNVGKYCKNTPDVKRLLFQTPEGFFCAVCAVCAVCYVCVCVCLEAKRRPPFHSRPNISFHSHIHSHHSLSH